MHAILLWQRNVTLLPTIIISVSERYKKLASKQKVGCDAVSRSISKSHWLVYFTWSNMCATLSYTCIDLVWCSLVSLAYMFFFFKNFQFCRILQE